MIPVLVVVLVFVAMAAAPSQAVNSGTWEGRTGQHRDIKLRVSGRDEVTYLKFTILVRAPVAR